MGLCGPGHNFRKQAACATRPAAACPFISPKNGKARTITPAPSVLAALKAQKRIQTAARIKAGPLWDNAYNLVFTTETGEPSTKAGESALNLSWHLPVYMMYAFTTCATPMA